VFQFHLCLRRWQEFITPLDYFAVFINCHPTRRGGCWCQACLLLTSIWQAWVVIYVLVWIVIPNKAYTTHSTITCRWPSPGGGSQVTAMASFGGDCGTDRIGHGVRSAIDDPLQTLQTLGRGTAFRPLWHNHFLFHFSGKISRQFLYPNLPITATCHIGLLSPYFFSGFMCVVLCFSFYCVFYRGGLHQSSDITQSRKSYSFLILKIIYLKLEDTWNSRSLKTMIHVSLVVTGYKNITANVTLT